MHKRQTKRASFLIADLLSNASPSGSNKPLPPETNSSDGLTGGDVIANDVTHSCIPSPKSTTSGSIRRSPDVRANHGVNFEAEIPLPCNFSSMIRPVPCPAGLMHGGVFSSGCFQVGINFQFKKFNTFHETLKNITH